MGNELRRLKSVREPAIWTPWGAIPQPSEDRRSSDGDDECETLPQPAEERGRTKGWLERAIERRRSA